MALEGGAHLHLFFIEIMAKGRITRSSNMVVERAEGSHHRRGEVPVTLGAGPSRVRMDRAAQEGNSVQILQHQERLFSVT